MKKIGKAIARKFKNWKTTAPKETATQEPKISSREEAKKPLEITIEHQPTVVTAKTTTARSEKVLQDNIGNIETPANAYENSNKSSLEESIEHKPCENSNAIAIKDIAASIEKLNNTGICENSTTNILTEIAAQPTLSTADSTDKANTLSSTEMKSCFDNRSGKENTVNEKEEPSTKVMQQRQATLVGILLSILSYSFLQFHTSFLTD